VVSLTRQEKRDLKIKYIVDKREVIGVQLGLASADSREGGGGHAFINDRLQRTEYVKGLKRKKGSPGQMNGRVEYEGGPFSKMEPAGQSDGVNAATSQPKKTRMECKVLYDHLKWGKQQGSEKRIKKNAQCD